MASVGIVPRATASDPGAKTRAALALACRVRRSLGSVGDHAIEIDEQDQAAVWSDGRAWE